MSTFALKKSRCFLSLTQLLSPPTLSLSEAGVSWLTWLQKEQQFSSSAAHHSLHFIFMSSATSSWLLDFYRIFVPVSKQTALSLSQTKMMEMGEEEEGEW